MRVAVVGCGAFGRNHLRVAKESARARLVAAVDIDPVRADAAARDYGCRAVAGWRELAGLVDAAIVATPTTAHAEVAAGLMEAGIDVLVEKPIASAIPEAQRLEQAARLTGRVLQVGHLERFNPAVIALAGVVRLPLFFEIHRLNLFAPRSLDVDVVLDLMIHDVDLVLSMTGRMPEEVRAAGVRILSDKVDIANVRLAFPGGCVANLTASRVSTERVRKLRLFQPHQYISIDYAKQEGVAIRVGGNQQIDFQPLTAPKREPLAAQFDAFLDACERKSPPAVDASQATRALAVCLEILARIEEHGDTVKKTLEQYAG